MGSARIRGPACGNSLLPFFHGCGSRSASWKTSGNQKTTPPTMNFAFRIGTSKGSTSAGVRESRTVLGRQPSDTRGPSQTVALPPRPGLSCGHRGQEPEVVTDWFHLPHGLETVSPCSKQSHVVWSGSL